MEKMEKREQPKSAGIKAKDTKNSKVLKCGASKLRFGVIRFGKDGCGY